MKHIVNSILINCDYYRRGTHAIPQGGYGEYDGEGERGVLGLVVGQVLPGRLPHQYRLKLMEGYYADN